MKRFFSTVAVLALLLGGLAWAQPALVYVDDDWAGTGAGVEVEPGKIFGTNAFATVQNGYDAVAAGGTVQIAAGLYDFSIQGSFLAPLDSQNYTYGILIQKSVQLLGPQFGIDPRPIAYPSGMNRRNENDPATEAILDGAFQGDPNKPQSIIIIDTDDVYVDGLVVRNGTKDLVTSLRTGSPADHVSRPRVRYCIVYNSTTDEGMQFKGAHDALFEFNYVHDVAGDGLNMAVGPINAMIRFNEMNNIGSTDGGIYIYDDGFSGYTDFNATIQGNVVHGCNDEGIHFGSKDGTDAPFSGGKVIDNIVFDARDGIRVNFSHTLIEGNEVYNCADPKYGVLGFYRPVKGIVIRNNKVHDNMASYSNGGAMGNNMGAIFIRNVAGFDLSTSFTIENNEFWNNAYQGANPNYKGYAIYNARFVGTSAPADRVVASNNYFGHVTGPDDDDGIINGQGDRISAGVDVLPILFYQQEFNPDSDGDGIPDQIERVLGTDPDDKDTDGDGVEDGVEWWMGSTVSNPLDTPPVPPGTGDSDGDGFADFYEVAKGTDPNDPNSYPLLGDINHNGRIDNIDAVIVFQIALGAIDLTEFVPEVPVMDVDRDTFITYLDAIDIFDFFLGNIDILPTD